MKQVRHELLLGLGAGDARGEDMDALGGIAFEQAFLRHDLHHFEGGGVAGLGAEAEDDVTNRAGSVAPEAAEDGEFALGGFGGIGFRGHGGKMYEDIRSVNERIRSCLRRAADYSAVMLPFGVPARLMLSAWISFVPAAFGAEAPARALEIETADETVYRDRPYWYKPGHPLHPADAATVRALPGFAVDRVLTVPTNFGSFTALAVDPRGRLLAASQHEVGIYRITPPPAEVAGGETRVEKLGGAARQVGWCHGLLWAFDSLYVTVAEGNPTAKIGVYRLRDTRGEDQFDRIDLLFELKGGGEHGPHGLAPGPDGRSVYLMGGNGTALPSDVKVRRPVATSGADRLLPPGYETSRHALEGWVLRFDPEGGNRELMASGLRNSYDLAFDARGELFTFDSDMEWDQGAPWYRPTRICHLVSGAEFGWRGGIGVWPEHYEDGVAPVINIGPASPTGVAFGEGTRFPARYQRALFACDWTFATIHAAHLHPQGAGYRAEVEEFVGGVGLPVTDIVVGLDGALYFAVGGRRLGSALYRVRYQGTENTSPAEKPTWAEPEARAHALRKEIETLHGRVDPGAAERVWRHLGHGDRLIRFAARVALEHQPVDTWKGRALAEADPQVALGALLALARQGSVADQHAVLERLRAFLWTAASSEWKGRWMRICEWALARGGLPSREWREDLKADLRSKLIEPDPIVRQDLARLLCFLGEPAAIDPLLAWMAEDRGERPALGSGYFVRNPKYGLAVRDMLESAPRTWRLHYAQMLLWIEQGWTESQHRKYFELVADAQARSRGGHQYRQSWEKLRDLALKSVPESQRKAMSALGPAAGVFSKSAPGPVGPGREWTLEEALKVAGARGKTGNKVRGRELYEATGCALCHGFGGEGGGIGPDLTTVGKRFTTRDLIEATLQPSKAISDQYQVVTLELKSGKAVSGRLVSRDDRVFRLAEDLMRPLEFIEISLGQILRQRAEPVSTMPSGLLNPLNEEELRDLLAFLAGSD